MQEIIPGLGRLFAEWTEVETIGVGVYAVLTLLIALRLRWRTIPWLFLSQSLFWSYLAQRSIFLFREVPDARIAWVVSALFMVGYVFLERKPDKKLRPPPRWLEIAVFVGIMLLGVSFRVYQIDTIPDGCYFDEAEIGKDYARKILRPDFSWRTVYDDYRGGVPITYWYPAGYFATVFGYNCLSVRLPAVISGLICLPFFYFLLRMLYGFHTAAFGTALMSISLWHVVSSRVGFSCIQTPMFTILTLFLFFLGMRKHWLWHIPAVLVYVVGNTSYHPSRTIIAIPALYLLHQGFAWLWNRYVSERPLWVRGVATVAVAGVLALPAFGVTTLLRGIGSMPAEEVRQSIMSTFQIPPDVMNLMGRRFLFTRVSDGDYWGAFVEHVNGYSRMFHVRGDANPRHNVPRRPAFNFFTGIFLVPGVIYCLLRIRWGKFFLPTAILFFMSIAPLIAIDAGHFLRSIGTMPAFMMMIAIIAGKTWMTIQKGLVFPWPEYTGEDPEVPVSPNRLLHARRWGWAGGRLVYVAFAVGLVWYGAEATKINWQAYFEEYPSSFGTWDAFDTRWYQMALYLNDVEETIPGQYKAVLLQEFTGNIPAMQYPAKNQDPWEVINYTKHIPLKDIGNDKFVIFILMPHYETQMAQLREYYPNALFQPVRSRFNDVIFYAIWVSDEDVRQAQGLTETHFSQGQPIYRAENVQPGAGADLTLNEALRADTITWEGLLYIEQSNTYTFHLNTDSPHTLEIAGQTIIDNGPEAFADGQAQAITASRIMGQGMFPFTITLRPGPTSERFRLAWSTPGEHPTPIPRHFLFTGEPSFPEMQGILYEEQPLRLTQVASWSDAIPDYEFPPRTPDLLSGMALDGLGHLYVLRGHRVIVSDLNGAYLRSFGDHGHLEGSLRAPESIVYDGRGNLFINDHWHHKLQKFDMDGNFLEKTRADPLNQIGAFPDEGSIYLANMDVIQMITSQGAIRILRYLRGRASEKPLGTRAPMGIVTDRDRLIYLSDRQKGRVWQMDKRAEVLRTWPLQNQDYKSQMAVDDEGRLYVTTFPNKTMIEVPRPEGGALPIAMKVQCFTEEGAGVLLDFRTKDGNVLRLRNPIGIAAGYGNHVYIADAQTRVIHKFRYEPTPEASPMPQAPENEAALSEEAPADTPTPASQPPAAQ